LFDLLCVPSITLSLFLAQQFIMPKAITPPPFTPLAESALFKPLKIRKDVP